MASAKKLTWYPWSPSAFRDETVGWSLRQKGVYRELLDLAWELGSLPPGPQRLRELVHAMAADWRAAWPLIEPLIPIGSDGQRRHARLEQSRAHALDVSSRRAEAGRAGAHEKHHGKKKQAEKDGNSHANGVANAIDR